MAISALKKIKISRMQQHMMLAVLVASLIFGVSLVLGIHFVKLINFNGQVIGARDNAISDYYQAIKNVGICQDTNKDGKYTDKELDNCQPDQIDVSSIPGTLRYNVMMVMANNTALESVARDSLSDCYKTDGTKINFAELYRNAESDEERASYFSMLKKCSALRVIPDALPAQKNEEALLSSLNQIFILSDWEPESLSPGGASSVGQITGLSVIPVNLSIEADTMTTMRVISNVERSIREFDIKSATIAWNGNENNGTARLELHAQADAYYAKEKTAATQKKTVYASKEAKKAKTGSKK